MTDIISAASSTERVMGPRCDNGPKRLAGHCGTNPKVGLKPNVPVKLAGIRIEPPASLARCMSPRLRWAATPAPPEDPPGVSERSQGLRVIPCKGESVTAFQPNSELVVLPIMIAPASRRWPGTGASISQGPSGREAREPKH